MNHPFPDRSRPIIECLRERARFAREEGTGTALGDALHFEWAADEIKRLQQSDALLTFLREFRSYGYGGDSDSSPTPPEYGIAWDWQATTTARPTLDEKLWADALERFERICNEMDPDDTPTEWDLEMIRHRDALREPELDGDPRTPENGVGATNCGDVGYNTN